MKSKCQGSRASAHAVEHAIKPPPRAGVVQRDGVTVKPAVEMLQGPTVRWFLSVFEFESSKRLSPEGKACEKRLDTSRDTY
jgi:hypothetical protein